MCGPKKSTKKYQNILVTKGRLKVNSPLYNNLNADIVKNNLIN